MVECQASSEARSENPVLKQRIQDLLAQISSLVTKHDEEMQLLKEQVTETRANLAGEFHIQLQTTLNEKMQEMLACLPIEARNALSEKEVLKV